MLEGDTVEKRFQGKSILQTHNLENIGDTQGTGYFGWASSEDCGPLLDEEVPKWASKIRADVDGVPGTSILVPISNLMRVNYQKPPSAVLPISFMRLIREPYCRN